MEKVRVLVVEDSVTVRRHLCDVLSADPELEVVGEAPDGKEAIALCLAKRPDVVTLDMVLPVMSGLSTTEYLMAHCPTPILIVSSSTNRGELFKTYEALAAGAVDVLEKPTGDEPDERWEKKLVSTVKLVARIKVITHPRGRLGALGRRTSEPVAAPPGQPDRRCQVIALGASTGGPGAVVQVLRALPAPLPVPVLLVLHIAEPFGAALAEWLDGQTAHRVAYAQEGEPLSLAIGRVLMAPPNRHLVVRHGRVYLSTEPERHSCRPSVDVLFESVAQEYGSLSTACLLTGMGRDGAAGLLAVRRAGGRTFAQDEATCVVYGMPREAVQLGAAEQVLPLSEIGPALVVAAEERP